MSKYNSELTAVNTSIEKLKKQWNDLTQLAEERYAHIHVNGHFNLK